MDFNFADLHETIARAVPEREGIVFRRRRFTYREVAERTRRLANFLLGQGLRVRAERDALAPWESGQAHLALYLYNGNEFLEGMLGAFKGRVAPLNVNYRYVDEELLYLFENAGAEAVLYHAEFAPTLARIRDRLPQLRVLLQVADDSGHPLLPGAIDYEEALASASPEAPPVTPSPDDLYIVYTGGTTGMPKGVLWRSGDAFVAAMGGRKWDGTEFESYDEVAAYCQAAGDTLRTVVGPPLMHAAAQWACFIMMTMGATVVFPSDPKRFVPADFLETIERERATTVTIVGDAFAVPLIDELERRTYDLSSLLIIGSGGAPLSTRHKRRLLELLPHVTVLDAIGSSETGAQATNPATKDSEVSTGDFQPGPAPASSPRTSRASSSPGTRRWGGSRSGVTCRSATTGTRKRRPARSRPSTAPATPCRETARTTVPTAPSRCSAATPSRSTRAGRRSSPRRSKRPSSTIPPSGTWWSPAGRASAGGRRSWPSSSSATARA
jgi:acyl-CoA synthetase (AMP-forming)/AMP-acid ligase II